MYVVIFIAVIGICYANDAATEIETKTTAEAITEFSLDVLKKVHEDGKNPFFSGYSIAVALGMVSLGAKENTLTEIDDTLYFDKVNVNDSSAIHRAFKSCAETYNKSSNDFTLTTANRLYGRETYTIEQDYQDDVKKYYSGELELVDFGAGTAEGIINDWVAEQTNNRIKDLFSSGSLDADTVLVLVNTVYFKAYWQKQFKNINTYDATFFTSETTEVDVKMMSQTSNYNYYSDSDLKVKVLELPYARYYASMFVLLPDDVDGLSALINALNADTLESLTSSVQTDYVSVRIPRFKIEAEYSLIEVLQNLGIHDLFDKAKCDLSAITNNIYVEKAIHKTFVQVTEEGTEAAAVTGVQIVPASMPTIFNANHPFLFVIRDNAYKIPLFVGAVSNPPAAEDSISSSE